MNILSFIIFCPIFFSLCVLLFQDNNNNKLKIFSFALVSSIIEIILSIYIYLNMSDSNISEIIFDNKFYFSENIALIERFGIFYHLAIDNISFLMIFLTNLLIFISFIVSYKYINFRFKEFAILFLLMHGFIIGSFLAIDILLFYIFFEAILIPIFLIIGIFGGENRIYSAVKLFLYTLCGSLLFLISIIYIIVKFNSSDLSLLENSSIFLLPDYIANLLWLGLFIAFAIKIPLFPFHSWLPDAHLQAPTAGSMILAGILIKIGAYGFIRFSFDLLPQSSIFYADFVMILSVISIIYASLIAFAQKDIKKMIAYSSIAHMGYVMIGLFSFTEEGRDGAIFQMISHGLVSAALFLSIGIIYERLHRRNIDSFGNVISVMPRYGLFFMIFTLSSIGLPLTSGFIGEFLTILAAFKYNYIYAILAASGVIFGACYMLLLYRKIFFEKEQKSDIKNLQDLTNIEYFSLAIIAILVIYIGIYPNIILQLI